MYVVFSNRSGKQRWSYWLRNPALAVVPGLIALCPALLSGQVCKPAEPTSTISTDRPSFTNASTTVPCRTLQLENGLNETAEQGERSWDLPQTLFRYGATSKTEFRFTAPDYNWNAAEGHTFATGQGDIAVGIKQQLGAVHGFDLAAIATLGLPTGAMSTSSHGYDTTLQIPWSRKLSKGWTAEGMFSVAWPTQNGMHNATGQVTALFDRQLSGPWDLFAEYAGSFPQSGGPQHVIDFGSTYKLSKNQQIDLRGGTGLSAAAVDHFVGAGYSFRFSLKQHR